MMFPSLPTELLKKIFRYATSEDTDPCPTITHAKLNSGSFAKFEIDNLEKVKTKIALTRASHRFRLIALEFLFEVVNIDRPCQAEKLLERMKELSSSSEMHPDEWVKFLFVRCPIPRLVTEILHLCCCLKGFLWNPSTDFATFQNWEDAQDEMIQNIPMNIRFFHWNSRGIQTNKLAAFLKKTSASLQILYISGIECIPISSYPSLSYLQVKQQSPFDYLARWTMPSFIELDLIDNYSESNIPIVFPDVGKTLRVLRCVFCLRSNLRLALSHIFNTCPNLEEISYYHNPFEPEPPWASDVTHMKLKKIVVVVNLSRYRDLDIARTKLQFAFRSISQTRFPSLDTIIVDGLATWMHIPDSPKFVMRRVSDGFRSAVLVPCD